MSDSEDYLTGFHDFAERVNRKLKAGYQLHGVPVSIERMLCQAMIKPACAAPTGETAGHEHPGRSSKLHFVPPV